MGVGLSRRSWTRGFVGWCICFAVSLVAIGCGCAPIDYPDKLMVYGYLDIPSSEPANVVVEACRNAVCGSLTIQSPPDPASRAVQTSGLRWRCSLLSEPDWRTMPSPGLYWAIEIRFDSRDAAGDGFEDGDWIFVRVTDAESGRMLVEHGQEVVYDRKSMCTSDAEIAEIELPGP